MLILSRKIGQSFMINGDIEITVVEISGDKAKIGIEAPKEVKILRKELIATVEQNKQAAESVINKNQLVNIMKLKP